MTFYTDSHAHLTSDELYPEVDNILSRAFNAGVKRVINICTEGKNLEKVPLLLEKYPWVYHAAAVHPHDAGDNQAVYFNEIVRFAKNKSLVAIGETGLDYHYHNSDAASQKTSLKTHLHLALETHLPVIIHCREAFMDFFSILDSEYKVKGNHAEGVLHCFTGNIHEAEEVLKRGFYISMSGIVTFKKSDELRAIAKMIPLDKLLIETDAPFLAPNSHRGKTNEPAFVTETAAMIAEVKDLPLAEVMKATTNNTCRLFKLKGLLNEIL